MGAKAIDLSGKVFGRLTSNHRHGTLNGQATWHCTCSCGNKTIVRSSSLTNGDTKSCGCLAKSSDIIRLRTRNLRESNINPLSSANKIFNEYKRSAKRRNLEFSISFNFFLKTIQCNCYWCNCSPKAVCISAGGHILIHNGIDRLDPEVGYTELNSLPSCSKCNYMKGSLSEGEFLTQIKEIVKFKGEM